jgi:tetratricopeptide (TPR) repeat protein
MKSHNQDKKMTQSDNQRKESTESIAAVRLEQHLQKIITNPTPWLLGLLAVVVVVAGLLYARSTREHAHEKFREPLGQAFYYVNTQNYDSALVKLDEITQDRSAKGLVLAKASLMKGQIFYDRGQYEWSMDAYGTALRHARTITLVASAARHGQAAALMQLNRYEEAAAAWESYLSDYAHKTGNIKDRFQEKEPNDLAMNIPDVLWKLALTYQALDQTDKVRSVCERLVQVYGDSRAAVQARKLLAVL